MGDACGDGSVRVVSWVCAAGVRAERMGTSTTRQSVPMNAAAPSAAARRRMRLEPPRAQDQPGGAGGQGDWNVMGTACSMASMRVSSKYPKPRETCAALSGLAGLAGELSKEA